MTLAELKPGDLFTLNDLFLDKDDGQFLLLKNRDKVKKLCVRTSDWTTELIDSDVVVIRSDERVVFV